MDTTVHREDSSIVWFWLETNFSGSCQFVQNYSQGQYGTAAGLWKSSLVFYIFYKLVVTALDRLNIMRRYYFNIRCIFIVDKQGSSQI